MMQTQDRLRQLLNAAVLVATLVILWLALATQIIDPDFWWHVTAGSLMLEHWSLPAVEPFAYTRVGEPYLATQSWLAQVTLSTIFSAFGSLGIHVLRFVLIVLALLPTWLLARRSGWFWLAAPLGIYTVLAMRPAILDRPQLFSFACFAFALWLVLEKLEQRISWRRYALAAFFLQVLWVNVHGGAALLHFALIGAFGLQALWNRQLQDVRWSAAIGLLLVVALFLSPNFAHTLTYVHTLLTDQTTEFIREWLPRDRGFYLQWVGPLWVAAIIALAAGRRYLMFSLVLLGVFGWLSWQSIRHEPFFLLLAFQMTLFQLANFPGWRRQKVVIGVSVLLLLLVGWLAYRNTYIAAGRLGQYGLGTYEPLSGSYEFLEREKIHGPVFHNYEAGGYLLYRGYPERLVFVDGRNVEHGYDFLQRLFAAEYDAGAWQELEGQYGFSHAVLLHENYREAEAVPYAQHLDRSPQWQLVFIDDGAAVYVQRQLYPEVAAEYGYDVLTPDMVRRPVDRIETLSVSQLKELEKELVRAIRTSPDQPQVRTALAALYYVAGAFEPAETILHDVLAQDPHILDAYNVLAFIRADQGRVAEAEEFLREAVRRAGGKRYVQ